MHAAAQPKSPQGQPDTTTGSSRQSGASAFGRRGGAVLAIGALRVEKSFRIVLETRPNSYISGAGAVPARFAFGNGP